MNKKLVASLLVLALAAFAVQKWYFNRQARQGLTLAVDLARRGAFTSARGLLRRYLAVEPENYDATMWLAETLIKDPSIDPKQAAEEALAVLHSVPQTAPQAAAAQSKIGSIELLLRRRPGAAEKALLRAMQLEPDHPEPHYLYWKLLDLTGRSQEAEPHVWVVVGAANPPTQLLRLREWYMSQFFPATAALELDRQMGVVFDDKTTPSNAELTRFLMFQQSEPDSPLGYAAEARWMLGSGNPNAALQALQTGLESAPDSVRHPFFISTMVSTYLDLGQYDLARQWFEKWPQPQTGYEYLRAKAIVQDEIDGNPAATATSYQEALTIWPGPADWRTRTRLANCLAQLRDKEAAKAQREEASRVEELMDEDMQKRRRAILGQLDQPEGLQAMVDLYEQLRRKPEAQAWRRAIAATADPPEPPSSLPSKRPDGG